MKFLKVVDVPNTTQAWNLNLPGSKSIANRVLLLSALSRSTIRIQNMLYADDTEAMLGILKALGYQIMRKPNELYLSPPQSFKSSYSNLDCKKSGVTLRMLPSLLIIFKEIHGLKEDCSFSIDADEQLKNRPHTDLFKALKQLGVDAQYQAFPITLCSSNPEGECEVSCETSGQYLSSLLLLAATAKNNLKINRIGSGFVQPGYIDMTLKCIESFGGDVSVDKEKKLFKTTGKGLKAISQFEIEPDVSTLCYFVLFCLVHGWQMKVNVGKKSIQPDFQFFEMLKKEGAPLEISENSVSISSEIPWKLHRSLVCDLNHFSDQLYSIAVLALISNIEVEITGVEHTEFHETKRVTKLIENINKVGGKAEKIKGGVRIYASSVTLSGEWHSFDDHRMAMAGFVLASCYKELILIEPNCVTKTCREFFSYFKNQGVALLQGE